MRQSGVVDLAKRPRIQVRVTLLPGNVTEVFWFLVDTGATYTQVSEGDLLKLGIQTSSLVETDETIFTAGNVLKQYVYPNKIRLNLVGKNYDFQPMRALIYAGQSPEDRKRFLENVPSLLGRDIILRHKMTLKRSHVTFES